ncbi:MAG: hypothetical protein U5J63_04515 [Fodinibius sp.]|nr:hypothetical protein [Fodinibius sp.]
MPIVIVGILFFNCCENKKPIEKNGSGTSSEKQFYQFDVKEKIPDHIQSLENVSIFPSDSDAPYAIKLIEEGRFGEKGEPFLVKVASCVVDNREGSLSGVPILVMSSSCLYLILMELFIPNSDAKERDLESMGSYLAFIPKIVESMYWITRVKD